MPNEKLTNTENDPWIAALMEEREGYVRRDLTERVKEVDNAIRAHRTTKNGKPQGRTAPRRQIG